MLQRKIPSNGSTSLPRDCVYRSNGWEIRGQENKKNALSHTKLREAIHNHTTARYFYCANSCRVIYTFYSRAYCSLLHNRVSPRRAALNPSFLLSHSLRTHHTIFLPAYYSLETVKNFTCGVNHVTVHKFSKKQKKCGIIRQRKNNLKEKKTKKEEKRNPRIRGVLKLGAAYAHSEHAPLLPHLSLTLFFFAVSCWLSLFTLHRRISKPYAARFSVPKSSQFQSNPIDALDVPVLIMWFVANSMIASTVCFGRSQTLLG
ncbi:unnamed protein product [Sphenostylis stenocarpa]|uniref:Uncharacterized protein n=1 Tax=Sphenostylis stenocarpa TaxID=92480 RepID=A0AA86VH18_9FABA|nr:unnamed protein product [Sphenostylis stenocarpa]